MLGENRLDTLSVFSLGIIFLGTVLVSIRKRSMCNGTGTHSYFYVALNHSVSEITHGNARHDWAGNIVVLKWTGARRQG
jgi:hypothetical protein